MDALENPVLKTDDPSLDALASAAEHADMGQDYSADLKEIESKSAQAPPSDDEANAATQLAEAEKEAPSDATERQRDDQGRFTKADGTKSEPNEALPEVKSEEVAPAPTDSAFEKAKKERSRQENLLKNFEQEKQRARAELEQERAQIAQQRAELEQRRRNPAQQDKFSSTQYADARNDFLSTAQKAMQDGDIDRANEYLSHAQKAEVAAAQAYQVEQQEHQQSAGKQHWDAWNQNMTKAIAADKTLGDREAPISKEVAEILAMPDMNDPKQPNIFNRLPDGFVYAVEVAKLRLAAKDAIELKAKNEKLTAENTRLTKLTSLYPSGPSSHAGPKNFSYMSISDMEKSVARQAEMADSSGEQLLHSS